MSALRQVGTVMKDAYSGGVMIVIQEDDEVYYFEPSSFYRGLLKYADKGAKLSAIYQRMEDLAEVNPEFVETIDQEIDVKELGFV